MCVLKKVVILLVLLSAIISPISASGDMSGGGSDMSGSSPADGGCYWDYYTGKTTCVDSSGSPIGLTGDVEVSPTRPTGGESGTIIITTSGRYSGGYNPGSEISGVDRNPWPSREPGAFDNPYETGGQQDGYTLGGAGVGYIGAIAAAATPPGAAVVALGAAAAVGVVPIVDSLAEIIKWAQAESEAQKAEKNYIEKVQPQLPMMGVPVPGQEY